MTQIDDLEEKKDLQVELQNYYNIAVDFEKIQVIPQLFRKNCDYMIWNS